MEYDNSLEKALRVLELLNSSAAMRIRDLHDKTGISKPTLVRILATLQEMGFARRISRTAGYAVSSRVLSLSSGFHGVPRVVEIAAPTLDELTERNLWPYSLATLDLDAMVVRYSTIPKSPVAHKQSTIHRRLSLSGRAHGRAYIAFCSPKERELLFRQMSEQECAELQPHIPRIRRQGWAARHPSIDPQTNSFAAPIVTDGGRVVATIGLTYFRRSVGAAEQRVLIDTLKEAAFAISRAASA